MRVSLSIVDWVARKFGLVNALVEKISERVLPKKEAFAGGGGCVSFEWCGSSPCAQGGVHYGRYKTLTDCDFTGTFYLGCDC